MYNFIKCAESCSRAPLASERSAIAPYILRALSTGIDMELLSDLFITELRHLAPRGSKKLRLDYFNSGCLTVQNKFASTQLSHMPRGKLVFTGPMSVQPVEHGSITLNQSPSEKPTIDRPPEAGTKKQSARAEALRIAKAKITRRNSLQKQRRLQKLDVRVEAVMRGKADIG